MSKIKKSKLVELINENKLQEFIGDDGALISSKMPQGSESQVTSDITTDEFIKKTRQGVVNNPTNGYHSLSFGGLQENEDYFNSLPQSVINTMGSFIEAMNDNSVSIENFEIMTQFIKQQLNGEQGSKGTDF